MKHVHKYETLITQSKMGHKKKKQPLTPRLKNKFLE